MCTSTRVSQRFADIFPHPEKFDPDRYSEARQEDARPFSWIAFGGGKHKCSGNAFAMLQLKAIFCILLRRYTFELSDDKDSYQDDFTQMVVQPLSPCRVRYIELALRNMPRPTAAGAEASPDAKPRTKRPGRRQGKPVHAH